MQIHFQELSAQIENIKQAIRSELMPLSQKQINWKPAPKKWSIGEVFGHLNKEFSLYRKQLTKIFEKTSLPINEGALDLKRTWWGSYLRKLTDPVQITKTYAPGAFKPKPSNYDKAILEKQLHNLDELNRYLQKANELDLDLNKLRLASPALFLIRFNLGEYFEVEVNHNLKHLNQARRVIKTVGFPEN